MFQAFKKSNLYFLIIFISLTGTSHSTSNEDRNNETENPATSDTSTSVSTEYWNTTSEKTDIRLTVIERAQNWLLAQRDKSDGWKDQTHRAIIALALSEWHLDADTEQNRLIVKELEFQLALALAKKGSHFFSLGQLSLYINALLTICRNPRDFYGINLVSQLYHHQDSFISQYEFSLVALTLCNAGVRLKKSHLLQLIHILPNGTRIRTGEQDHEILAILALQCATQNTHHSYLKRYVDRAVNKLKRLQDSQNGGFGNIYTSSLITQVLIECGKDTDWNKDAAISYLMGFQQTNGSFSGNVLATFLALPPVTGNTLVSISRRKCNLKNFTQEETECEKDEYVNTTVALTLSLWTPSANLSKIVFATPNSSIYNIISKGHSGYRFQLQDHEWGHYVRSINEIEENVAEKMHWYIYKYNTTDDTTSALEKGIDDTFLEDKDHYVFVYRKRQ